MPTNKPINPALRGLPALVENLRVNHGLDVPPVEPDELSRIRSALATVIKPEYIEQWLETPNGAFDGRRPVDVVEAGEGDRVWRMIREMEWGTYS
jgi:hypothetical protein